MAGSEGSAANPATTISMPDIIEANRVANQSFTQAALEDLITVPKWTKVHLGGHREGFDPSAFRSNRDYTQSGQIAWLIQELTKLKIINPKKVTLWTSYSRTPSGKLR